MYGWWRQGRAGLRARVPGDAPRAVRRALAWWRLTVVVIPAYILLIGLLAAAAGVSFIAAANAAGDEFLGFLFALLFLGLGLALLAGGAAGCVVAPFLFWLLGRARLRIVSGEIRGVGTSGWLVGVGAGLVLGLGGVLVLAFSGLWIVQLIVAAFVLVVLGPPFVGPLLYVMPSVRRWAWLRARASGPRRAPPQEEFELTIEQHV